MTKPVYAHKNFELVREESKKLATTALSETKDIFAQNIKLEGQTYKTDTYTLLALTKEGFEKLKKQVNKTTVNNQDPTGTTLLHSAARINNIDAIDWLFQNGAKAAADKEGYHPLFLAYDYRNLQAFRALASHGIPSDLLYKGKTILEHIFSDSEDFTNKNDFASAAMGVDDRVNPGLPALLPITGEREGDLVVNHEPSLLNAMKKAAKKLLNATENKQVDVHFLGITASFSTIHLLATIPEGAETIRSLATKDNVSQMNDDGRRPLYFAAQAGNTEGIRALVEREGDYQNTDNEGNSIIHALAQSETGLSKNEYLTLIENFLNDYEVDLISTNKDGLTPLHLAAGSDNYRFIQVLVDFGIDLNTAIHGGETALHSAAATDAIFSVEALLEAGAKPTEKDSRGFTPAMLALNKENSDTFYHFFDNNHFDWEMLDDKGRTLASFAIVGNHISMLSQLLQFCDNDSKKIKYLLQTPDNEQKTGADYAKKSKSREIRDFVSEAISNMDAPIEEDSAPKTSLETLLLEYLWKKFPRVNQELYPEIVKDFRKLHPFSGPGKVFEKHIIEMTESAMDHIVRMSTQEITQNDKGQNFLHYLELSDNSYENSGIMSDHNELEKLKTKLKDAINAKDKDGFTPLDYSCSLKTSYTFRCLLLLGADPLLKDPEGNSTLARVALEGHLDMLKLFPAKLLAQQVNNKGLKLMHAAAIGGHRHVVEYLHEKLLFSLTTKDKNKKTPADLCKDKETKAYFADRCS